MDEDRRGNRDVLTPVVHKGEPGAKRKTRLPAFGFPDVSASEESACHAGDTGEGGLIPGPRRPPGAAADNPPVFLPGKPRGQRSQVDYGSWGCKVSKHN